MNNYVLDSAAELKLVMMHPLHLNPDDEQILSKIIKLGGYNTDMGPLCYVFDIIDLITEYRIDSGNPVAADNLMKIMNAAGEREIDIICFSRNAWRFSGIPWYGRDNDE